MPGFNSAIINAVNHWQETAGDKVLRCSNDNCWDILEPVIAGDKVVLRCMNCRAVYEDMLDGILLEKLMSEYVKKP